MRKITKSEQLTKQGKSTNDILYPEEHRKFIMLRETTLYKKSSEKK